MQITKTTNEYGVYMNITGEKNFSMSVCQSRTGIYVVLSNASHRTWRGSGNRFDSFDHAKAHYKSKNAKAALEMAEKKVSA